MAAVTLLRKLNILKQHAIRAYTTGLKLKKGLVLGAFTEKCDFKFTKTAHCIDQNLCGALKDMVRVAEIKKGKVRIFYKLLGGYDAVAVVGLGREGVGYNEVEEIDEKKEDIRLAAAAGVRALQDLECTSISVEDFHDAESAAEGATLAAWLYQEWKNYDKRKRMPEISCYDGSDSSRWCLGVLKGNAQNFARHLSEAPSNEMTPTRFAEIAQQELSGLGVNVSAYDKHWAVEHKMGAFLSVTRGSQEPPKFLEICYTGACQTEKPIVLVGKGVTFDTGGISLKPANKMEEMRADMGGAACVLATIRALASLKIPMNIVGLIPLCENMPSGSATKPGDIVTAMNGKNIQVDNTDAEGRLILADALCYAARYNPFFTIDIATLTGSMRIAMGGVASGVFTNSNNMWEAIKKAGIITGDRVWRFPLYKEYTKRMTDFPNVDINNVGKGSGGGACTAAAFLKEFAPPGDWMHIDIAGVMGPDNDIPYLQKGMTGRPTRTLIQLIHHLAFP